MHKPETCTAKTYSHVRGAPLRGDILRQLAEGAEHIAPDMRIPKRALDRLFYFEPLVTLSCDEEAALKAAVWNMMADKYSCYVEKTNSLLSGRAKVERLDGNEGWQIATRNEIAHMLSGKDFAGDVKTFPLTGGEWATIARDTYFSEYCTCNLESYMALDGSAIPVLKLAHELLEKNNRPIRVLDVGANGAQMLYDLKRLLGHKVETHALAPFDEPHHKVDQYHMLIAERMPSEFRESFDLVVTRATLMHAILAHRALENIAETLAPGGIAIAMLSDDSPVHDDVQGWEASLEGYCEKMTLDVEKYIGHGRTGVRWMAELVESYHKKFKWLGIAQAKKILAMDSAVGSMLERSDMNATIIWGKHFPYQPDRLIMEKKE